MPTNVNVAGTLAAPVGGGGNDGTRLMYISAVAKAAPSDTVTITNCTTVLSAHLVVATGVADTQTISGNVITLTGATGSTTVSGILLVK